MNNITPGIGTPQIPQPLSSKSAISADNGLSTDKVCISGDNYDSSKKVFGNASLAFSPAMRETTKSLPKNPPPVIKSHILSGTETIKL